MALVNPKTGKVLGSDDEWNATSSSTPGGAYGASSLHRKDGRL